MNRLRLERQIASQVAEQFTRNITSAAAAAPADVLAHHFGLVCKRMNFIPTKAEAGRILRLVAIEIAERREAAERLYLATSQAAGRC